MNYDTEYAWITRKGDMELAGSAIHALYQNDKARDLANGDQFPYSVPMPKGNGLVQVSQDSEGTVSATLKVAGQIALRLERRESLKRQQAELQATG